MAAGGAKVISSTARDADASSEAVPRGGRRYLAGFRGVVSQGKDQVVSEELKMRVGCDSTTECPAVRMTRDPSGVITSIDEAIFELLGWRPEELVGSPSTNLIHPADHPGAVAEWMAMITSPGRTGIWRGRYKTAQGTWRWVETENRFHEDGGQQVITSMREVSPEQASLEEQFLAREQLLS